MRNIRTHILFTVILLLAVPGNLAAQQNYVDRIAIAGEKFTRSETTTTIDVDFDFDKLNINHNHLLIVTPVLYSKDGSESVELPAMAVLGTRRNTILNRPHTWKNKPIVEELADYKLVSKRGSDKTIAYSESIPYQAWHKNAALQLRTEVSGCAECDVEGDLITLLDRIFVETYTPSYTITVITPEVEPVKERVEKHTAYLNYRQGRHELLYDYKDNAGKLDKVAEIINEVRTNKDLTFTNIEINGYASPEGNFQNNITLSENRARSFAQFIIEKYDLREDQMSLDWHGEDWDGLRKALEESTLGSKDAVFRIIDSEPNHDARDDKFIAIDEGRTYEYMLYRLYPPLRRNDYSVGLIARSFNVEEAKQIIKTRPNILSLNEMFLVAETYPKGSKEYNEVFEIAARTFPDDIVSNVNAAAIDLQNGNADAAYNRLIKLQDHPKVWNNLAIAMSMKGMYKEAAALLEQAAAQGDKDARGNAEELNKLIETM